MYARAFALPCGLVSRRGLLVGAAGISLVGLGVSGCVGGDAAAVLAPADLQESDVCHRCGMMIADPRFAGQYVTVEEKAKFCDVGELFLFLDEFPFGDDTEVKYYAMDFEATEWIDATTAVYVVGGDHRTPMETGTVAFKDSARAQHNLGANGEERTFEQLLAAPPHPMPVGDKGMDHGDS